MVGSGRHKQRKQSVNVALDFGRVSNTSAFLPPVFEFVKVMSKRENDGGEKPGSLLVVSYPRLDGNRTGQYGAS